MRTEKGLQDEGEASDGRSDGEVDEGRGGFEDDPSGQVDWLSQVGAIIRER